MVQTEHTDALHYVTFHPSDTRQFVLHIIIIVYSTTELAKDLTQSIESLKEISGESAYGASPNDLHIIILRLKYGTIKAYTQMYHAVLP
jgi:hypothetical protein